MKMLNKLLLFYALFAVSTAYGQAPSMATIFKVTIHGTSNLHDWSETVGKVNATASIDQSNKASIDIAALSVIMDVSSIKSTEGAVMDNNTYKALKEAQYPEIKYILAGPANSIKINGGVYILKAKGNITIAGVTKEVEMNVKIHGEGGKMVFEGSQTIKMSDYNIKPPVAMLGMLKTGNELTINYYMVF